MTKPASILVGTTCLVPATATIATATASGPTRTATHLYDASPKGLQDLRRDDTGRELVQPAFFAPLPCGRIAERLSQCGEYANISIRLRWHGESPRGAPHPEGSPQPNGARG